MKRNYEKYLLLICALLSTLMLNAQSVVFDFNDGISEPWNKSLKANMERQVSNLLSELNRAASEDSKTLNLSSIRISRYASQSISMLWENIHLKPLLWGSNKISERCLHLPGKQGGYMVRNINVEIIPLDGNYKEDINQGICICFDKSGMITDFNIQMDKLSYDSIMKDGELLGDFDKRIQIIGLCDYLATAYHQKDIKTLDSLFSEDAIIITGREIHISKSKDIVAPERYYKYTVQDKKTYLRNLSRLFSNPNIKSINVMCDKYSVVRDGEHPHYYGVTFRQIWKNEGYKRTLYQDDGIVFLKWDFEDEDNPKILVRTWQPISTPADSIFTIHDFKKAEEE